MLTMAVTIMNNDLMFSSDKDDWETPQALFDELDREFDFTLDAAATEQNKKCDDFLLDGIAEDTRWQGRVWCNPPYGKLISKFVFQAYYSWFHKDAELVVMLLPARTDTKYFHDYIYGIAEIRFLKGRLKFEVNGVPAKHAAPFPSMLVVYK